MEKDFINNTYNLLRGFRKYTYYRWFYVAGTILVFFNSIFFHNGFITLLCLLSLFCILFYKGIKILHQYRQIPIRGYQYIKHKDFMGEYRPFRIKIFLFIVAFIILCIIAKFKLCLNHNYFYACTFFFLLLDRLFINEGCLLQKISDPKSQSVICCCGCPCRGWDLLMIHLPLLFALNDQSMIEDFFICISSILAIFSFVGWERNKYYLVEVRPKCKKPCNLNLCREHLH